MVATTGKRRGGFSLAAATPPPQPKKTPMAKDLVVGVAPPLPPPKQVAMYFQEPCDLWAAIDVETHEFVPSTAQSWWREGQFGLLTRLEEHVLSELRIVQVGWAVGSFESGHPTVKARIVTPSGFEISGEAAATHRISNEVAISKGQPAREALAEMTADVFSVVARGGRLCSHNLDFDAGIVLAEMRRADFAENSLQMWSRVAGDGLCTMDPAIGHWVRQQIGVGYKDRSTPMRLRDLVTAVLPEAPELLKTHHDAGSDALMHWLVARELARRALTK